MPVVSGIGHEVDYTIADIVADVRAATPTMAAMTVTPDRLDLLRHIDNMDYTLGYHITNRLNERTQRLDDVEARLMRAAPAQRITSMQQQLDYGALRLRHAIHQHLTRVQDSITRLETRLGALDPQAVLQRGFALVRDRHGQVVRQVTAVQRDDTITIQLSDGQLTARITEDA
jgi:exodeoxyribonuclease VII large subunit